MLSPRRCRTVFRHGPASGSYFLPCEAWAVAVRAGGAFAGHPVWPARGLAKARVGPGEGRPRCSVPPAPSPLFGVPAPLSKLPPLVLAARGAGPALGPQRHGGPERHRLPGHVGGRLSRAASPPAAPVGALLLRDTGLCVLETHVCHGHREGTPGCGTQSSVSSGSSETCFRDGQSRPPFTLQRLFILWFKNTTWSLPKLQENVEKEIAPSVPLRPVSPSLVTCRPCGPFVGVSGGKLWPRVKPGGAGRGGATFTCCWAQVRRGEARGGAGVGR